MLLRAGSRWDHLGLAGVFATTGLDHFSILRASHVILSACLSKALAAPTRSEPERELRTALLTALP